MAHHSYTNDDQDECLATTDLRTHSVNEASEMVVTCPLCGDVSDDFACPRGRIASGDSSNATCGEGK